MASIDQVRTWEQDAAAELAAAQAIFTKAESEGQNLSAEEQSAFDAHMKKRGELVGQARRATQLEKAKAESSTSEHLGAIEGVGSVARMGRAQVRALAEQFAEQGVSIKLSQECARFLANQGQGLGLEPTALMDLQADCFEAFAAGGPAAVRRLSADHQRVFSASMETAQADVDPTGGYLIAPMTFMAKLIQALDEDLMIRSYATTTTIERSESLGANTLAQDFEDDDDEWTNELLVNLKTSKPLGFKPREWRPNPLARLIRISKKLIRLTAGGIEDLAVNRFRRKFGRVEEKHYCIGNGDDQPLGLFFPSDHGISTARDVSADNTTTEVTYDGLMNAKYKLRRPYRKHWLFSSELMLQIAKIKEPSTNRFLLQPDVTRGAGDIILGMEVVEAAYVPNSFTAGSYVGLGGDLAYFHIVDALLMEIQRLIEMPFAGAGEIGLLGTKETDGMVELEEPFVRLQLAS